SMDRFTGSVAGPDPLPRNVRALLAAYERGEFPKPFLDYLARDGARLLAHFLDMFAGYLSERTVERLTKFVHEGEIAERIRRGLEAIKEERDETQRRIRRLKERREDIDAHPEQMLEDERRRALEEIDLERRALIELVKELEQRYVLNFFTDEGLLP